MEGYDELNATNCMSLRRSVGAQFKMLFFLLRPPNSDRTTLLMLVTRNEANFLKLFDLIEKKKEIKLRLAEVFDLARSLTAL